MAIFDESRALSRRSVLRLLAVGSMGSLLAACAPAAPPAPTAAPAPKPTTAPAATSAPAAAAKSAGAAVTLPAPEQTSLRIGHAALEAPQLYVDLARQYGFYTKHGITSVEVTSFADDAKAVQALISGQVDAVGVGASGILSSQMTDTPLVGTTITIAKLVDLVVTSPEIKTPADMKGKAFAISSFGSSSHGAALMAVKGMGLAPNDVTIQQVGGDAARVAALKGGSVGIALTDPANEKDLTSEGFNVLYRLLDAPGQFARATMAMRKEWLQKNPNTALAIVAALLEAQNSIWVDPKRAMEGFAVWTQATDLTSIETRTNAFLQAGSRNLRWDPGAWLSVQEVLTATTPAIKDVNVENAYTYEYIDKLRDMGFNDAIGAPR